MKPTSSQAALLHAVLSAAVAVIMAFGVSIAQFYFAHGQDLILTGSFAVGSFAVVFAAIRTAVWHAAITSPALPQAERDTESQAQQVANQALAEVRNLAQNVATSVIPFMHNHPQPAQSPVVSRAVTTPAARTPQAITFPQPNANATAAPHISFGDTGQMPVVPPNA